MHLERLSILNYKNIAQADLLLSPNVNCFVGANGMGKTNVLDAIFYLSFCKSASNLPDRENMLHGADYCIIDGIYSDDFGGAEHVVCGLKGGARKHVKRNGKTVQRLAEHIGTIPLVLISPSDISLVGGGSEERRRFMDTVISQYDAPYLNALIRYDKALKQRNALLKLEEEPDATLMDTLETMMDTDARVIFAARKAFVEAFTPIFRELYARLCNTASEVPDIEYASHGFRGPLKPQLEDFRAKERIVGYTLHGTHKDDLLLKINTYPVKHEASQGQTKTYVIAMKLAQYLFLKEKGEKRTPLLLLDDIFDKLDAGRVERIVNYTSGEALGQIFITDTDRGHIDRILEATHRDYRLFTVVDGRVSMES